MPSPPTAASHQICQIIAKANTNDIAPSTTPALLSPAMMMSWKRAGLGPPSPPASWPTMHHDARHVWHDGEIVSRGGEAVAHSSVLPFHGSPVETASAARSRMLTAS